MKKNRIITILAMAGAALALAACTVSVNTSVPRNFAFRSSWQIEGTGEWARCENRPTEIQYQFEISRADRVERIYETYQAVRLPDQQPLSKNRDFSINNHAVTVEPKGSYDLVTVTHQIDAGDTFLPLSVSASDELSTQAIVVTPIPKPETILNGETDFFVRVETRDSSVSRVSPTWRILSYANCN